MSNPDQSTDERAAFIRWLCESFPAAWTERSAAHAWDNNEAAVSAWHSAREPLLDAIAELKARVAPTEAAAMAATVPAPEHVLPLGAIVNGKTCIDRLERDYAFQCDAGPLVMCADWDMLKRCFFHLAEHAQEIAQRDPDPAVGWSGTQAPVAGQPAEPSPTSYSSVERIMKLQEDCDALRTALEVIALGDAEDPVRDAGDTLVELGHWRADALTQHRAEVAAPKGDSNG